jgi:hypothetical protein
MTLAVQARRGKLVFELPESLMTKRSAAGLAYSAGQPSISCLASRVASAASLITEVSSEDKSDSRASCNIYVGLSTCVGALSSACRDARKGRGQELCSPVSQVPLCSMMRRPFGQRA